MKLEILEKANAIKEKIDREKSILDKLQKLNNANKNKELTSEDIKYVLMIAYEGVEYIINDLTCKFENL